MFFEIKKYTGEKNIPDIIDFFKEHKINFNSKHFKSEKILKLKIYNEPLYGGDTLNNIDVNEQKNNAQNIKIKLRNDNYEARIYEYNDGYFNTINFVKLHSIFNTNIDDFNENDICSVIIIDCENNASIQSVSSYTDCIRCFEDKTFKIGEILIQIMVGICVYKNVNKIQLTDNSYLSCGNEKIPLIYLRTLTNGKPYYTKFNFLPINHNKTNKNEYYENELEIYKDNIEIFNKNPTIKKKKLIKILNYKKFDQIKDKNMIDYIGNVLIPRLTDEKILISNFVSKLIKNKISCELLKNILMEIYNKCGYNTYKYKYFEFILENKYKNIVKTHIQISPV